MSQTAITRPGRSRATARGGKGVSDVMRRHQIAPKRGKDAAEYFLFPPSHIGSRFGNQVAVHIDGY
jgi:hypothetical protein